MCGKETTQHCRGDHASDSSGYGASYHKRKIDSSFTLSGRSHRKTTYCSYSLRHIEVHWGQKAPPKKIRLTFVTNFGDHTVLFNSLPSPSDAWVQVWEARSGICAVVRCSWGKTKTTQSSSDTCLGSPSRPGFTAQLFLDIASNVDPFISGVSIDPCSSRSGQQRCCCWGLMSYRASQSSRWKNSSLWLKIGQQASLVGPWRLFILIQEASSALTEPLSRVSLILSFSSACSKGFHQFLVKLSKLVALCIFFILCLHTYPQHIVCVGFLNSGCFRVGEHLVQGICTKLPSVRYTTP